MLSLAPVSLGFASTPVACPPEKPCPECPPEKASQCFSMPMYDMTVNDEKFNKYAQVPRGFGIGIPESTSNSAYEPKYSLVSGEYQAYGAKEVTPGALGMCHVEAGTHLAHAEGFNGAKVEAILTASECVKTSGEFDWQHDPRYPAGEYCFIGSMDGLNAKAVMGNGGHGTKNTGKTYMRAYMNTELSGSNDNRYPRMAVSKSTTTGGYGQPAPAASDILKLVGATEQFADIDRDTLEVVNGGHAVKKIFTASGLPYQTEFPADATSNEIFTIVKEHSQLHVNVQPDEDARFQPNCDDTSDAFSDRRCGLYGHCGSKICPKHEFSYMVDGKPAYGATAGVGFEDDVLFVAQEGGLGGGQQGTVQVLDVDSGDWYQLPHLSMGVVEMSGSMSSGHKDYIMVYMQDYGVTDGTEMGRPDYKCGSGWNVWIGMKDPSSSHFLDRNGLGVNQGRIYRFVADSGETDMANFVDWPASGMPGYKFTDKPGRLEPIDHMFNGIYKETPTQKGWNATSINCANTVQGNVPIRMTGVRKQEWGAVNPDKPNQWAIAETGLGKSVTVKDVTSTMPLGDRTSTLIFLEHNFLAADLDGGITSRNGSPMPTSVPAKVFHVMKDQVVLGPDRGAGLSYVDSLYWAKGGSVYFAEDSSAPGGYNIAGAYNIETEKSVALVGAIGDDNKKYNVVANFPYGSIDKQRDQETTGWFDASAALTAPAGASPQAYYDALDGKTMILDNQMKGVGNGCMDGGFYYTSQMMFIDVPEWDWKTEVDKVAPPACDAGTMSRRKLNKKYQVRRGLKERRGLTSEVKCDSACGWEDGHDHFEDADGCQCH